MVGNKKILMTADTIGGVWTYSLELCRAFEGYGAEIHLAVMGKLPNDIQKAQLAKLSNVVLYESDFKLEWMQDPWSDLHKAKEWLVSIYNNVKPDIMHFNNFGQVDYAWHCPVVTVFHSCVMTWWKAVKNEQAPQEMNKYKQLVKKALHYSDVVVFPSESIRDAALEIYGHPDNIEVIYNSRYFAVDDEIVKEPFIFCAGRLWDEAKNVKLLTEIASRLSWPVFIAGDNEQNGISPNPESVIFLGQLSPDEVQQWMAKASIYVLPAKYEPFGLSVLEAAKSGCALALSDIDTFQEIWQDNAVYFNPERAEEAISSIQSLINDAAFRISMSRKAFERAQYFDPATMAANYRWLYEQALKYELAS
jgi:glycogen(starch) synthase